MYLWKCACGWCLVQLLIKSHFVLYTQNWAVETRDYSRCVPYLIESGYKRFFLELFIYLWMIKLTVYWVNTYRGKTITLGSIAKTFLFFLIRTAWQINLLSFRRTKSLFVNVYLCSWDIVLFRWYQCVCHGCVYWAYRYCWVFNCLCKCS